MNELRDNSNIGNEIDLIAILKSVLRQRGLIVAFGLCFFLLALSYQLSKVAFFTPKTVNYPVAIEFISTDNDNYPNGAVFSIKDLISPENINAAIKELQLKATTQSVTKAIRIRSSNDLFEKAEKELTAQLGAKKVSKEQVKSTTRALEDLTLQAKTYATLELNLVAAKLSSADGEKLLAAIVKSWSDNAIKQGLVNPNVSYPSTGFTFNKEAIVIDNYDKLDNYIRSLQSAIEKLSELKGSDSIIVDGTNLNDISRQLNDLLSDDVEVMRAYAYSISPQLVKTNPMLEVQIYAQRRVKSLNKQELQKQIEAYDDILTKLDSNIDRKPLQTQLAFQAPVANANDPQANNIEKGTLDELLDLGSQLSSSELKKEVIQKRIEVSTELFKLEKELAMIEGESRGSDMTLSENQTQIIEAMPEMFEKSVAAVNEIQKKFISWVEEYKRLVLAKGSVLYSDVSSPYTANKFGISVKKVFITLFAALLMGLALGVTVALMRSSFIEDKSKRKHPPHDENAVS